MHLKSVLVRNITYGLGRAEAAVVRRDGSRSAARHSTGASLADLQQAYSLSRGSVQRLLRDAGVRRRRKSLTDVEVAVLVNRYGAGLTLREIASEQGLPKTTVQDALARAGMAMRPSGRRNACG
jgi:DNA-directed RNA polymerase specialized sigma24 family protein